MQAYNITAKINQVDTKNGANGEFTTVKYTNIQNGELEMAACFLPEESKKMVPEQLATLKIILKEKGDKTYKNIQYVEKHENMAQAMEALKSSDSQPPPQQTRKEAQTYINGQELGHAENQALQWMAAKQWEGTQEEFEKRYVERSKMFFNLNKRVRAELESEGEFHDAQ